MCEQVKDMVACSNAVQCMKHTMKINTKACFNPKIPMLKYAVVNIALVTVLIKYPHLNAIV